MKLKQRMIGFGIGVLCTLGLVVGTASAGLWNTVSTAGWDNKDTTARYKVDVKGFDVRAYEWVPADNPNIRMVFVAGESSSGVGSYSVQ